MEGNALQEETAFEKASVNGRSSRWLRTILVILLLMTVGVFLVYLRINNDYWRVRNDGPFQVAQKHEGTTIHEENSVAQVPEPIPVLTLNLADDTFQASNATKNDSSITLSTVNGPSYVWDPNFKVPENADLMEFKFKFTKPGNGDFLSVTHGEQLIFAYRGDIFNPLFGDTDGYDESGPLPALRGAGATEQLLFALNKRGTEPTEVVIKDVVFYTVPTTHTKADDSRIYDNDVSGYSLTVPAGWYLPRQNELQAKFYKCPPRDCAVYFSVTGYTDLAKTHGLYSEGMNYETILSKMSARDGEGGVQVTSLNTLIQGAKVVRVYSPMAKYQYYVFFDDSDAWFEIGSSDSGVESILSTLKLR